VEYVCSYLTIFSSFDIYFNDFIAFVAFIVVVVAVLTVVNVKLVDEQYNCLLIFVV
jgi:Na+-transporting NADH:ubiquinone oxidoreductase subunit NqrE